MHCSSLARVLAGVAAISLLTACSKKEDADAPAAAVTSAPAPTVSKPVDDNFTPEESAALQEDQQLLSMVRDDISAMSPVELAEMLPDEVNGLARVDASANPDEALGAQVSNAAASYGGDALRVSITDLGGMEGLARLGMGWIDGVGAETEDGFQRTGTLAGFKTFETYDGTVSPTRSEYRIFVGERFVVEILGDDVEWDTITAAARSVNLTALDQIRKSTGQ